MTGPDPNSIYPNENIRQVVYIKNVISRPNILVGDYTYYDDIDGTARKSLRNTSRTIMISSATGSSSGNSALSPAALSLL